MDDLNKKIEQIGAALGYNNIPDNIKDIIASLAASTGNNAQQATTSTNETTNNTPPPMNSQNVGNQSNINTNNIAQRIMGAVNPSGDNRMNLLAAIKPLLNPSRQKKIADCIKILQLAKLSSILEDRTDK